VCVCVCGSFVGLCPKEKLFKGYIELELQVRCPPLSLTHPHACILPHVYWSHALRPCGVC
jgi:hypothetical protein